MREFWKQTKHRGKQRGAAATRRRDRVTYSMCVFAPRRRDHRLMILALRATSGSWFILVIDSLVSSPTGIADALRRCELDATSFGEDAIRFKRGHVDHVGSQEKCEFVFFYFFPLFSLFLFSLVSLPHSDRGRKRANFFLPGSDVFLQEN